MYHPNFIDTIPTDHAQLNAERIHHPDPRPKWGFRFVVLAIVLVFGLATLFSNLSICR